MIKNVHMYYKSIDLASVPFTLGNYLIYKSICQVTGNQQYALFCDMLQRSPANKPANGTSQSGLNNQHWSHY